MKNLCIPPVLHRRCLRRNKYLGSYSLINKQSRTLPAGLNKVTPRYFLDVANIYRTCKVYCSNKNCSNSPTAVRSTTISALDPAAVALENYVPTRRHIFVNTHLPPARGPDAYGRSGAGCERDASTITAPHLYVFAALKPAVTRVQSRLHAAHLH